MVVTFLLLRIFLFLTIEKETMPIGKKSLILVSKVYYEDGNLVNASILCKIVWAVVWHMGMYEKVIMGEKDAFLKHSGLKSNFTNI